MDPNETLKDLREAIRKNDQKGYYTEDIMNLFKALDDWLSRGGFLPDAWKIYPSVCDNSLIEDLNN